MAWMREGVVFSSKQLRKQHGWWGKNDLSERSMQQLRSGGALLHCGCVVELLVAFGFIKGAGVDRAFVHCHDFAARRCQDLGSGLVEWDARDECTLHNTAHYNLIGSGMGCWVTNDYHSVSMVRPSTASSSNID